MEKKSLSYWMRYLHNNVGFFIVGLVIIYSLSGILQTYRDSDLFKVKTLQTKTFPAGLEEGKLGEIIKLRGFKVIKTEGNIVTFKEGTYNKETGEASYSTMDFYPWMMPFMDLHKAASQNIVHYFTNIFSLALMFMSISAFWMFKPGTKLFSRAMVMTLAGIVASVLLLFIA